MSLVSDQGPPTRPARQTVSGAGYAGFTFPHDLHSSEEAMPTTITCRDQTTSGRLLDVLTLQDLPETIRLRDLIQLWVREEVAGRNLNPITLPAPVHPAEADRNGHLPSRAPRLDWKTQTEAALRAFARNRFVVLIGNRQVADLDESIDLSQAPQVAFLRLVPFVGG
jgi:hypothetical protein